MLQQINSLGDAAITMTAVHKTSSLYIGAGRLVQALAHPVRPVPTCIISGRAGAELLRRHADECRS